MGRIWMPGVSDGADLDAITATAWDVLKGKVIVDKDGNPLTGMLELTGSAADSQVLAGKTYYNTDAKTKRTGTLPNQGAVAPPGLNAGGSYTIPAGYHNGQGKVTANSLASQTGVQSGKTAAGAGQILTGYEAWVNGGRVAGIMINQGKKEAALNCGGSYTIPEGYHNGQGKVTANSLASQTDATAAAGDILSGKTAWAKGIKTTGTMATMAGQTITPSASQQTVNCSGKKMTGNIVINAIPSNYGTYHDCDYKVLERQITTGKPGSILQNFDLSSIVPSDAIEVVFVGQLWTGTNRTGNLRNQCYFHATPNGSGSGYGWYWFSLASFFSDCTPLTSAKGAIQVVLSGGKMVCSIIEFQSYHASGTSEKSYLYVCIDGYYS